MHSMKNNRIVVITGLLLVLFGCTQKTEIHNVNLSDAKVSVTSEMKYDQDGWAFLTIEQEWDEAYQAIHHVGLSVNKDNKINQQGKIVLFDTYIMKNAKVLKVITEEEKDRNCKITSTSKWMKEDTFIITIFISYENNNTSVNYNQHYEVTIAEANGQITALSFAD